ncbi:MAG: radical SAM protein [Oscillospiraceae bacterium]|nr:radical SAM protein [Clostridiales bacterium]
MTGNQTELQIIEHMHRRAVAQGIPLSGTFELTPLCSMACKMCYVRMSPEELAATGKRLRTADEWLALAREAKEQGMLLLLLTGGEPFLYPEFRRLYTELRQMGFVISINSNATLITEETVAWLKENPPQRINITLYGASDATYARLCGHPTGFTQVTRAIELLRDAGISVKLNCSVTPENVCDLEDIIAYSDEHKLVLQATSYMFPPLRRDAESVGRNARFAAEECARTEVKIRRLQYGAENLREYCKAIESHQPVDTPLCADCEGEGLQCRAGKSAFWVTWDGRMTPCGMVNEPAVFPFGQGFADAWQSLRAQTAALHLPPECAGCDAKHYCHTCAAMCYTETGRYDCKPQYRCDLMRAVPAACRALLSEEEHHEE